MTHYNPPSPRFIEWWSGDRPTELERERVVLAELYGHRRFIRRARPCRKDHDKKTLRGLRKEYARFNGLCQYCGRKTTLARTGEDRATVDHVVPYSKGGQNVEGNRALACYRCNQWKGSKDAAEFRAELRKGSENANQTQQARESSSGKV